jgi:PAT family beta-lactamase induction signal transducer AmpG
MQDAGVTTNPYLQVFASRRIAALLVLGFASGLPLALSAGTLQAWLTVEGVDLSTIGFFALAGLPYTFKFVWAPLADRFEPPLVGRRRSWLVITQASLAALCLAMSMLEPGQHIGLIGVCAVAIAFMSASQDIIFDAYRTELLGDHERGAGAAVSVLGYRLAMLVSGGLALILADTVLGWAGMYRLMALLFAGLAVFSVLAPETDAGAPLASDVRREWVGFAAMLATGVGLWLVLRELPTGLLGYSRLAALAQTTVMIIVCLAAAIAAARKAGFPSFVAPWDAFFARERALALLALIVLYKLGDAFAGALSTTFLIRGAGFSAAEVGAVNKVLGLAATIVGVVLGGAWLARRPLYQGLMLFGILQAVSNLGYWLIAVAPKRSLRRHGYSGVCGLSDGTDRSAVFGRTIRAAIGTGRRRPGLCRAGFGRARSESGLAHFFRTDRADRPARALHAAVAARPYSETGARLMSLSLDSTVRATCNRRLPVQPRLAVARAASTPRLSGCSVTPPAQP